MKLLLSNPSYRDFTRVRHVTVFLKTRTVAVLEPEIVYVCDNTVYMYIQSQTNRQLGCLTVYRSYRYTFKNQAKFPGLTLKRQPGIPVYQEEKSFTGINGINGINIRIPLETLLATPHEKNTLCEAKIVV